MKKRLFLILCLVFVSANLAIAQTKTVTNADLEKFRQKRLAAEQEYRQNYARLGFPSPEELEMRREQDRKEMSELSRRLQIEDLAREQRQREEAFFQAQIAALNSGGVQNNQGAYYGNGYYSGGYYGGFPYFGYSNYGYSKGFYNNFYYRSRFLNNRELFPRSLSDPRGFAPRNTRSNSARFNSGGLRINITTGGRGHFPAPIRSPR